MLRTNLRKVINQTPLSFANDSAQNQSAAVQSLILHRPHVAELKSVYSLPMSLFLPTELNTSH
jgi:hypothetical protein